MRNTTCILNCDDQMLTLTRFYSNDIFDSSKQVVSSFNIKLTESKSLKSLSYINHITHKIIK